MKIQHRAQQLLQKIAISRRIDGSNGPSESEKFNTRSKEIGARRLTPNKGGFVDRLRTSGSVRGANDLRKGRTPAFVTERGSGPVEGDVPDVGGIANIGLSDQGRGQIATRRGTFGGSAVDNELDRRRREIDSFGVT